MSRLLCWSRFINYNYNYITKLTNKVTKLNANSKSFSSIANVITNNNNMVNNLLIIRRDDWRSIFTCNILMKDKGKGDKKKKACKATKLDLREAQELIDCDRYMSKMEKEIEELKNNFIKHLTVRSSTGSIEQIPVEFNGNEYLLQELVQTVYKPKMVVLNCINFPQAIPQILEALNKSGMNLNPQQDGTTLFVPTPKVTKEHRENLAKNAKAIFIKTRDNIKDVRNKEFKSLKKKTSVSEDQIHRIQSQLDLLCEQYVKKAEDLFNTKQKELLKSE